MKYDVFISYKRGALDGSGLTRDCDLAFDLHKTFMANGINSFFSERDLFTSNYKDELDNALDEAKVLIAVGTKREHLESPNVKYEWISFDDDLLQGIKKGEIYTYLEGIKRGRPSKTAEIQTVIFSRQKGRISAFCKGKSWHKGRRTKA